MKKLSIIIVNYNVCHFLEQALQSIYKAIQNINTEIFVVDNNSIDHSIEMIKNKFPHVILIENKNNVGFSKANNQAILKAHGEYILLLNPDTIVEEDTFIKCCNFMDEHQEAGALGVKMLDGKGNFLPESKRGLPSPWVAFYKVFGLAKLFPKSKKFGRYHLGFLHKDQIHQVDILSGAYMFIRKKTLDIIGLLDEDYFMYGEDIDLSYRIIKNDYKNYYYPETRIIHYKGESTKKTSINYVFIFYKAMIIFAEKHFSSNNASIFSFLINIAIYIRAGIAILVRSAKQCALPLADITLIYTGMYFLKTYWETTYKSIPGKYPVEFMNVAVPTYILIWLSSIYFNGGYSKPFKSWKIITSAITGTVIIAAGSNFFDTYRFSKALILMGGIWTIFSVISLRLVIHFIKYHNFQLGLARKKKVVIIGDQIESIRVKILLTETNYPLEILGCISPNPQNYKKDLHLGSIQHINDIILMHDIDEVIFCSKNIEANQIIEWMTHINSKSVEFKIVPDESNYIIGSNSKDTRGDFYTLTIELNIIQEKNIRNKRILDIIMSILFLPSYPLFMWFVKRPKQFAKNIFLVLSGKYSWVGFTHENLIHLPTIKKGIINPVTSLTHKKINANLIHQLNLSYARDYSVHTDVLLILRSFKHLG